MPSRAVPPPLLPALAARHGSERPPPPVRWRYRLYNHVFKKKREKNQKERTASLSETGTPGGAMSPPPRVPRARGGSGPPVPVLLPGKFPHRLGLGGVFGPVPGWGSSGRAVCASPSLPSIALPFPKAARATCAACLGFGVWCFPQFRACPRFLFYFIGLFYYLFGTFGTQQ